jgi:hypothetical protein
MMEEGSGQSGAAPLMKTAFGSTSVTKCVVLFKIDGFEL